MANTYSQIYMQIIFAVKDRYSLVTQEQKKEVEKYIGGIINSLKSKPLAIYCNPDHIHILVGLHPSISISELVKRIKTSSNVFIKEKFNNKNFSWQDGYGAFSYSRSQIDSVIKYINNQQEHHKKRTFRVEYIDILQKAKINYDDKYLFSWIE